MAEQSAPLPPLSADEETFVRAWNRASLHLMRAVDADMINEARLTLREYQVMMHLSEAPERRMRMSELAAVCDLSLSGMTRIVGLLEAEHHVERVRSAEDGRGWHAVLTDAGLAHLRRAYPTHLASVRRHLFDRLAEFDVGYLARAMESVAAPGCGPTVRIRISRR
ncbi:MAG TPA: MarR family winged helix-turn-helix transcriptional regulator [Pseudonocardia sp.]|nr:MarR family winged helix-turn-helix transcriptional regulator [Pseudonocardia sp.]